MKLKHGIEHALNGEAVLFTGAGFSKGATNILGHDFPTGGELATILRREIGIDEQIDLKLAAEMFVDKQGTDRLIEMLRNHFTVKDISEHQTSIASVDWRRVYTTNYDNVLESAYAQNSKKLTPVTLTQDPRQFSEKDDVCVHINGYVDQLTRATLFDSFKLTDTSYLAVTFHKSNWAYIFRSTLRQSQAMFFLGYSLCDIDITRILYEEPELVEKCFFITAPNPSEATKFTLEKYGRVLSEGLEGFSQYLNKRKRTWNPAKYEPVYVAFEHVQAGRGTPKIKDQDIFDLFLYGRESRPLIYDSLLRHSDVKYYIRRSPLDTVFNAMEKGKRTFLVTSSLGNGKSLFCLGLAYTAMTKGYRVFLHKETNDYLEKEISAICKIEEPVIVIFENYHRYLEKIRYLQLKRPEKLVLVLTCRTEISDIYYDDLEKELQGTLPELLNVDQIDSDAAKQLVSVFEHYGLWGYLTAKSNAQKLRFLNQRDGSFQRLLLELLKSPDITKRFTDLLQGLNEITGVTEVIVVACVLTLLNHPTRPSVISELLESNVAWEMRFRKDQRVRQIVVLRQDTLGLKSAIFGRFILSSIPDSNLVIDTVIRIAKRAEELSRLDKMYRFMFRDLIRFGNLQLILPERQRRPAIVNFYEALKNLGSTKENPHFWLQYAIARLSFPDLDEAKIYFDTSYALAESRSNYDTTQIDNHYARYLLERTKQESNTDAAFEQFREAHALLSKQIFKPNRHYPYRVAIGYYDFFLNHFENLDDERKGSFLSSCQSVLARIGKLATSIRAHWNVKECKEKLDEIVNRTTKNAG